MALIKCPECAHEISDKATTCMNCGHPMKSSDEQRNVENINVGVVNTKEPDGRKGKEKISKASYVGAILCAIASGIGLLLTSVKVFSEYSDPQVVQVIPVITIATFLVIFLLSIRILLVKNSISTSVLMLVVSFASFISLDGAGFYMCDLFIILITPFMSMIGSIICVIDSIKRRSENS